MFEEGKARGKRRRRPLCAMKGKNQDFWREIGLSGRACRGYLAEHRG